MRGVGHQGDGEAHLREFVHSWVVDGERGVLARQKQLGRDFRLQFTVSEDTHQRALRDRHSYSICLFGNRGGGGIRVSRIAELVVGLDPQGRRRALGMDETGMVRYLADAVDRDRLQQTVEA